jgi:N utilization substance protein B
MDRRTRAREVALQLLYQHDLNPEVDRQAIERFVQGRLRSPALEPFALALYDGVRAHARQIDSRLTLTAQNWRLQRMAAVDRNVLRLGAYELLHTPDTPAAVALNEAIELARRYGSADSPAFVNGVLDQVHQLQDAEVRMQKEKQKEEGPQEQEANNAEGR